MGKLRKILERYDEQVERCIAIGHSEVCLCQKAKDQALAEIRELVDLGKFVDPKGMKEGNWLQGFIDGWHDYRAKMLKECE